MLSQSSVEKRRTRLPAPALIALNAAQMRTFLCQKYNNFRRGITKRGYINHKYVKYCYKSHQYPVQNIKKHGLFR
jgi:hypothetical protein